MPAARRLGHRWIADGPCQGGAVVGHLVEERLMTADRLGDHPQEPSLDVLDPVVEEIEQRRRAGDGRFGEHLPAVAMWISRSQGMPFGQLAAPIEHLLPI